MGGYLSRLTPIVPLPAPERQSGVVLVGCRRMAGHVEMENAPPIVANDKEAIKHTEGDGGHREEVHGRDGFAVVAER